MSTLLHGAMAMALRGRVAKQLVSLADGPARGVAARWLSTAPGGGDGLGLGMLGMRALTPLVRARSRHSVIERFDPFLVGAAPPTSTQAPCARRVWAAGGKRPDAAGALGVCRAGTA